MLSDFVRKAGVAGVLILAAAASGATPEALIAQLGDDSWKTRRQAEQALVELGPSARPAIHRALTEAGDGGEIAQRLEAALAAIGDDAEAGVTRITLTAENLPAGEVVDELRRLGADVALEPEDVLAHAKPVTADWQARPVWEVLRELTAEGGLYLRLDRGRWVISTNPRQAIGQGPSQVAGAALLELGSVRRDRTVNFSDGFGAAAEVDFYADLNVFFEAKLRPAAGSMAVDLAVAEDEAGHDLIEPMRPARAFEREGAGWTLRLHLAHPDGLGETIQRLAGEARCDVLAGFHTIDVAAEESAGFATSFPVAGGVVRVDVVEVRRTPGGRWEAQVRVRQPAASAAWQPFAARCAAGGPPSATSPATAL